MNIFCKLSRSFSKLINYEKKNRIALIKFNRPKALNALCNELITEMNQNLLIAQ